MELIFRVLAIWTGLSFFLTFCWCLAVELFAILERKGIIRRV